MWRLGVVVACASAACLSKPEPAQPGPGDAGGEDGTSPDAPAPVGITRIGHTTGTALASAGRIQVTPPTNAESGDLVLLFIDRFNTSGAVANASGWQPISQLGVDADSQEVGYRIAGASEQTDTTSYNFPAPQDAPWVLIVYRGATFVGSTYGSGALGTDNGMGRYVFTLHDPQRNRPRGS